jgi:hypothetical protein
MKRCLLVAAFVALVCGGGSGCGGDGESLSDGQIATESLISTTDLSSVTGEEDGLPAEPCGPVLIFENAGARAEETDLYAFGDEQRVQEAIGVFAETAAADSAYEELTGAEHFKCIQGSIAEFNAGEKAVQLQPVRSLRLGDKDAMERFLLVGSGSRVQSYADLEAIQIGRCLASIIVLSETRKPTDAVIAEVSTTAAEALEDTCG